MTRTDHYCKDPDQLQSMHSHMSRRLADLRARFAARAAGDVDRIEDLVRILDVEDVAAAHEVKRLSHQMAGSAGSFGFSELGVRASSVEQEAEKLCLASGNLSVLKDAVHALKQALSGPHGMS